MNDRVFRPCPFCRTGLDPDSQIPVYNWEGKEWHVFNCAKNCKSVVWVLPFAGIKEPEGKSLWSFWKR